jgi:hypothetical protein
MVLAQDAAQASEAQAILDEQKYQKDLAQYNKDLEKYNKEKAIYDAEVKKIADAKAAEEKRIAEEKAAAEKKKSDRAAEYKVISDEYNKGVKNNPYEYKTSYAGHGFDNSQHDNYLAKLSTTKREAERVVRTAHLTQDGWTPTPIPVTGWLQPDAAKQLGDISQGRGRSYRSVDANSAYQVSVVLANRAVQYGEISISQHSSQIAAATAKYRAYKTRQSAEFSKQARAASAGQLAADAKHWQSVANDPNTSGSNQATINSLGLSHNVQQLDDAGLSTLYNETDLTKAGSLPSAANVTINSSPIEPNFPTIPVRTNTSSNKGVNEANQLQQQYVKDLREGKIGIAQALLNPQTPQSYPTRNTINTKQFLSERGYDVNKPETIPDSIFMNPQKYDDARKQASSSSQKDTTMGDLRKLIPASPQVSDAVITQRRKAMENIAASKGGSYIGYGIDGTPIQGAPFTPTKYEVTTKDGTVRTFNSLEHAQKFSQRLSTTVYEVNIPTTIPTIHGAVTVQEPILFDSKEEAQSFIDNRQANLPYTQDSKILPMEKMYRGYDKFADEAYQRAKDHVGMESSWIYEGGAAWTSFGADILNAVTMGGDLIDKHVLKRPVVEKQPVSTIPTYYDKGTEKALEGIKLTETGVTGITPSLFDPTNVEGNILAKYVQGAVKQWGEQTDSQNIGQSTVAIPVAILDILTAKQAGVGLVRGTSSAIAKVGTKIASTPRIVTKVIEASVSVKAIPKTIDKKLSNTPYATADNFSQKPNTSMSGEQLLESLKPKGNNYAATQGDVRIVKGKNPPLPKEDLGYVPEKIDLNFKGADYSDSPKPPTINLNSKAFQKDLEPIKPNDITTHYGTTKDPYANPFVNFWKNVTPREIPKPSEYRAASQSDVILAKNTFKKNTVKLGEQISHIERNPINVGGKNIYGFTKQSVSLEKSKYIKNIKGETLPPPNYDRAASDFVDFQKSLTTQKYTNIVGEIKFSKGFTPNKYPSRIPRKKQVVKDIETDPLHIKEKLRGDGKDIPDGITPGGRPINMRVTPPDKVVHLPKGGKAPITGKEKYVQGIDFYEGKLPKGGHAPIGYVTPTPKSITRFKKTVFNLGETKKSTGKSTPNKSEGKENTGKDGQIAIQIHQEKNKMNSTPQPPDPIIDASIDRPLPIDSKSSTKLTIIPPIMKPHQEKKIIPIKSATIPRVIQTIKVTQTSVVKAQQRIGIRSSAVSKTNTSQTPRIIQAQPQKVSQVVKQKQALSSPLSPKPKVRQSIHPVFKLRSPQKITHPTPLKPRAIAVTAILPPPKEKKVKQRKTRKRKRKDFLGNTKTDHIVGLFKRTEVITGDKKVAKQLKRDKKFKEGKKKRVKRTKKKTLNVF